jgi:hypothetical protein
MKTLLPPVQDEIASSELWKHFGLKLGFHAVVADVLHELGYAYSVMDSFTRRLLPMFRAEFEDIERQLGSGAMKFEANQAIAV